MMSILMYVISLIAKASDNDDFSTYIDNKYNKLELWITDIEKCNQPKHIDPLLLLKMRNNLT